jgi:hypothetical protein
MAIPVHTKRFFSGIKTGAGPADLYTVPTDYRIRVRAINVMNGVATGKFCAITIDSGAAIFGVVVPAASGVAGLYQWEGFVALDAGQKLNYVGASSASFSIVISGYLYPLVI